MIHSENAIEISHLVKRYPLYQHPKDRLKEALSLTHKCYHQDFYALNDISFSIRKGESVGIIGTNGSGKSTLLKIIVGVLNGSSGTVETEGRISAMLELGAGFNMDYTGIENIYFHGTIMGIPKEEMDRRVPSIIEFADIGDFIHQPVKTYSSGMFVRLAFATQIYSDPDILIVDEALSVGDLRFQQKCYRAMERMMKDKTVILVTHDPGAVLRFCKRAIWLERGNIRFDGLPDDAIKQYQAYLIQKTVEEGKGRDTFDMDDNQEKPDVDTNTSEYKLLPIPPSVKPKGSGDAIISGCVFCDAVTREAREVVEPGQQMLFAVHVRYLTHQPHPLIGLAIRDRLGNEIIGINSNTLRKELPAGDGEYEYVFHLTLPQLNKGEYTISVAVANGVQEDHMQLCWLDDVWVFRVPPRLFDIPGLLYLQDGTLNCYRKDAPEGEEPS